MKPPGCVPFYPYRPWDWALLTALGSWCTQGCSCWAAWAGHGHQRMLVSKKQVEMLGKTCEAPKTAVEASFLWGTYLSLCQRKTSEAKLVNGDISVPKKKPSFGSG